MSPLLQDQCQWTQQRGNGFFHFLNFFADKITIDGPPLKKLQIFAIVVYFSTTRALLTYIKSAIATDFCDVSDRKMRVSVEKIFELYLATI